mmetsp:Transcript_24050/g.45396  ORF Transcript_24050/g.45396 Transcript_24050/m.45396 type:complete len:1049 (+) Transcript_24050:142-3288(+)
MAIELPPPPPPPNGQVLALLAALSNPNPTDHSRHALALQARDDALSSSPEGYGDLCRNFCRVLGCPSPQNIPLSELESFHNSDREMFQRCCGWIPEVVAAGDGGAASPTDEDLAQRRRSGMVMWNTLRQMAGLLLKNALVTPPLPKNTPTDALGRPLPGHGGRMALPPDAAAEIKHGLLRCIADEETAVRSSASTAIARCCTAAVALGKSLGAFAVKQWGELLPFLLQCIVAGNDESATPAEDAAAMGALVTLRKLLEDIPNCLSRDAPASSFQDMVPALLRSLRCPSEGRRKEALACLNCFIEPMPGSLVAHMNDYLGGLSALAADPSPSVRRLVCQGIVAMLNSRTEYLQPHMVSIAEFMLRATADADSTVALEACEFWLTFASLDEDVMGNDMMEMVVSLFPRLLPQLLKGMVYPPDKIEELMEANALDENGGADRNQDMAPVFHKSRTKGHHDDDDDSSDNDDDEMDDDDNEWTLRKCSAASLDALSGLYGAQSILPPLLPALQEGLGHTDQWVREASILALGAIADGCKEELGPHMAQLHPFLLSQLTAPESLPQLRCISAWTLGRFASWAVDQMHAEGGDTSLVGRVAEALVGRLLDRHKKVQVAVCSALGVFVESAADLMAPYLDPIYRTLMQALQMYRTRSIMVLFDTLGTMADYIGPAIGEGNLPGIYVPPLLKHWNEIAMENPFDRSLLPLMECLGSSTVVIGMNYQPWALETFEMAMSTIEACTLVFAHEEDALDADDEMADPMICAVDLIDGLVEGLGPNIAALVCGSSRFSQTFPNVLQNLAEHIIPGVRMSVFALIGDLARQAPALIEAGLPNLLSEAVKSIDPTHPAACNNAVWAIGEVCVRCGENSGPLTPHAPELVQRLIAMLMGNMLDDDGDPVTVPGLAENAATTMGRLASVNANFVAPELGRFLTGWCEGMSKISNPIERRDAFQGFVAALRANPQSLQQAGGGDISGVMTSILFAIVSWHIPQDDMSGNLLNGAYGFQPFPSEFGELLASLRQLVLDLKTSAGNSWSQIESTMPVNVKRLMKEVYLI